MSFQAFWTKNPWLAPLYFDEWYLWAVHSQLEPMAKVAKSLKQHRDGILRWFKTKMTNGFLEGINSLIQAKPQREKLEGTEQPQISLPWFMQQ
nr:transposase [Alkalihalobacterium alkalinitrilicum]